jgi:hypothetical protein
MARGLDELVAAFRTRPLDAGPYAYLWINAQTQRCRAICGRLVNRSSAGRVAHWCEACIRVDMLKSPFSVIGQRRPLLPAQHAGNPRRL